MPNYIELGFDDFIERRITGDAPDVSSLEPSGGSVMGLTGDFGTPSSGSTLINSGNSSQFIGEQALEFDRLRVVIGQNTNTVGMSGEGAESTSIRIWAGESFTNRTSAPFRVDAAGNVTATSITITGGSVGGWTITATTLYGLASGTPSAAPSDGIVMTSGATANITIYEDTDTRIVVGNLSAGVYGIRGFDTGSNVLFELSDTRNVIAGWVITDGYIYNLQSGTPTAAPNDGIVMASGNEGLIVYEDTAERVRVGYISAGVYGVRGFATNGTDVIFEFSDTRQVIGGWNFTDTVLRSGASDAASNVLIDSANSLIRLGPTSGDTITLDGANLRLRTSNYVSGQFGSGFTLEPDLLEVGNASIRGMIRTAVFETGATSATSGSLVVSTSADKLNADMTALDASTVTIEGNVTLAVNDVIRIREGTDDEWMTVTNIASAPTYTVTRDGAGSYAANTNPAWPIGASVVNYGASGAGGIYITADDTNAPYLSVFTHSGSPWTDLTTRLRLGNLNGYLGYVADIFGIGIGSSGAGEANITIDPTNGIRIRQGTTNRISLDMAGAATLFALNVEGSLNIFTSGNLRSGQTAYNTGTGWFMEYNAGTPRFSIGDATAGNSLTWDGTTLRVNNRTLSGYDLFGDGNDGDVTISGNTTLTRDMFYENLVIDAGFVLSTAGYRVFARTSVTINGTIRNNGSSGGVGSNGDNGGGAGGAGGSTGTGGVGSILTAGLVGVAGGAGANGVSGNNPGNQSDPATAGTALTGGGLGGAGQDGVLGGRGGNNSGGGGSGGGPAAGAVGAAGSYTAAVSAPRALPMITSFHYVLNNGTIVFFNSRSGNGGSSGGSSGDSATNSNSGAGGGAGGVGGNGGCIFLSSLSITVGAAGIIEALGGTGGLGGNGGNGSGTGSGAGGGGGGGGGDGGNGGLIGLIYSSLTNNGTISVLGAAGGSGGTGGTPQGAGNSGVNGSTGTTGLAGIRIDIIV